MATSSAANFWTPCFERKHCVVVGGCGGLGSTVVKQLLAAGANVTVIDALIAKNPFPRKDVTDNFAALEKAGALCIQADSADEEEITEAMAQANEKFGAIHCHLDAAWRWLPGPQRTVLGASEADWTLSMKNITGAGLAMKAAQKYMSKGATVVLCGAFADQSACPALMGATFGTAHAGRNQLVRDAAVEFAGKGIRCNCVNAGAMRDTPMYQFVGKKMFGGVDNMVAFTIKQGGILNHTTMQRAGTSEEVANSMLFMASNKSSYTTGQKIYADGGLNTGIPMGTLHNGFNGVTEKMVTALEETMAAKKRNAH